MLTNINSSQTIPTNALRETILALEPVHFRTGIETIVLSMRKCTVGSAPDCEFRLSNPGVRPHHCVLLCSEKRTVLKAFDRHTWLNEGLVQESIVFPGDVITIGPVEFRVRRATTDEVLEQLGWESGVEPHVASPDFPSASLPQASPPVDQGIESPIAQPVVETPASSPMPMLSATPMLPVEPEMKRDDTPPTPVISMSIQPTVENAAPHPSTESAQSVVEDQKIDLIHELLGELNREADAARQRTMQFERTQKHSREALARRENELAIEAALLRQKQADRDELSDELSTMRSEIARAEESLRMDQNSLATRKDDLADREAELAKLKEQLLHDRASLEKEQQSLTERDVELELRETRLIEQENALRDARNSVEQERHETHEQQLQFERDLHELNASRKELIATHQSWEEQSQEWDAVRMELEEQLKLVDGIKAELVESQTETEELRNRQQQWESDHETLQTELQELTQQRRELQDQFDQIEAEQDNKLQQREADLEQQQADLVAARKMLDLDRKQLDRDRQQLEDERVQFSQEQESLLHSEPVEEEVEHHTESFEETNPDVADEQPTDGSLNDWSSILGECEGSGASQVSDEIAEDVIEPPTVPEPRPESTFEESETDFTGDEPKLSHLDDLSRQIAFERFEQSTEHHALERVDEIDDLIDAALDDTPDNLSDYDIVDAIVTDVDRILQDNAIDELAEVNFEERDEEPHAEWDPIAEESPEPQRMDEPSVESEPPIIGSVLDDLALDDLFGGSASDETSLEHSEDQQEPQENNAADGHDAKDATEEDDCGVRSVLADMFGLTTEELTNHNQPSDETSPEETTPEKTIGEDLFENLMSNPVDSPSMEPANSTAQAADETFSDGQDSSSSWMNLDTGYETTDDVASVLAARGEESEPDETVDNIGLDDAFPLGGEIIEPTPVPSADPDVSEMAQEAKQELDAEDPDSIAKYMEQLLARNRQGSDEGSVMSSPSPQTPKKEKMPMPVSIPTYASESQVELASELNSEVSQPEETVALPEPRPLHPERKQALRANMDSMREVANLSARSALATHSWKRFRGALLAKIVICIVCFATAGVMFVGRLLGWFESSLIPWTTASIGCIMLIELMNSALNTQRRTKAVRQTAPRTTMLSDTTTEISDTSQDESEDSDEKPEESATRESDITTYDSVADIMFHDNGEEDVDRLQKSE